MTKKYKILNFIPILEARKSSPMKTLTIRTFLPLLMSLRKSEFSEKKKKRR